MREFRKRLELLGVRLIGFPGLRFRLQRSQPGPQRPLIPPYVGTISRSVGWVTGPYSKNDTFDRFGIGGTDLGIAWDNGRGQTLMAFGDTFGNCNAPRQEWRHNVLLRSNDNNLADGLSVPPNGVAGDVESGTVIAPGKPNFAQELIPSLGISNIEVTTIPPTAAISLPYGNGFRQYINYMSVRSWGFGRQLDHQLLGNRVLRQQRPDLDQRPPTRSSSTRRSISPSPGNLRAIDVNNGKFQQNAYMRGRPGSDEAGYIYQFGTPNGRFGAAFLARFKPADILDLDKYEYWSGERIGWVDSISDIHDTEGVVARQPVSELSVAWSPYLNKYIMLDGDNGIRLRTANHPEGPWSSPRNIVGPGNPVVYGPPMMLPNSPALTGTGKDLYFNASRWSDYNVMLIRSDLSKL